MRLSLLAAMALACGNLQDPGRGCPAPCPAGCAGSCLPSGYCVAASYSPAAPVSSTEAGGNILTLGNLPPSAAVRVSFHLVFDTDGRAGRVPWDYWIQYSLVEPDGVTLDVLFDQSAYDAVDFPIVGDASATAMTDSDGVLHLHLIFDKCIERGSASPHCLLLPQTVIAAQVIDPSAWTDAPACN